MKSKMDKSSKKKMWIGIGIGAIVGIITLHALFLIFMLFFAFGGKPEVVKDISRYEEMLGKYENAKTAYIVFPEKVPESATDTDFYFSDQDTWNVPTLEVYLQCTYNEEDYQAEICRLEDVKKQYGSQIRTLLRDEEGRYPYPVYIAQDGYWDNYEYAMLTGENQITYVYTAMLHSNSLKKVDKKLLPKDFDKRQEAYTGVEGYTIYLKDVNYNPDGSVSSWSCDYTRDVVAEVTQNHWVEIGYNRFYVTTYLNEHDEELIKECSFYYYESQHDSVYGLPETIVYTELADYFYKDVEISADKGTTIVTYYDGTEVKEKKYVIPEEVRVN